MVKVELDLFWKIYHKFVIRSVPKQYDSLAPL